MKRQTKFKSISALYGLVLILCVLLTAMPVFAEYRRIDSPIVIPANTEEVYTSHFKPTP